MLLGLLVYEMATGKRPFADIYPLSTVVLAVVNDKVKLNVEADHFLQKHSSSVSGLAQLDQPSLCTPLVICSVPPPPQSLVGAP